MNYNHNYNCSNVNSMAILNYEYTNNENQNMSNIFYDEYLLKMQQIINFAKMNVGNDGNSVNGEIKTGNIETKIMTIPFMNMGIWSYNTTEETNIYAKYELDETERTFVANLKDSMSHNYQKYQKYQKKEKDDLDITNSDIDVDLVLGNLKQNIYETETENEYDNEYENKYGNEYEDINHYIQYEIYDDNDDNDNYDHNHNHNHNHNDKNEEFVENDDEIEFNNTGVDVVNDNNNKVEYDNDNDNDNYNYDYYNNYNYDDAEYYDDNDDYNNEIYGDNNDNDIYNDVDCEYDNDMIDVDVNMDDDHIEINENEDDEYNTDQEDEEGRENQEDQFDNQSIISTNYMIRTPVYIRTLFPYSKDVVYEDLQMTEIGLYSISNRHDSGTLTRIINQCVQFWNIPTKSVIVTDGTSGIGGNAIAFAMCFMKVNAIELDTVQFTALKNNVHVYGLKNVDCYFGNCLKIIPTLEQHIIFLDPPWGGKSYKQEKELTLEINDIPLVHITNQWRKKCKKLEMIAIKIPKNFSLCKFANDCNFPFLYLLYFRKYNVLILSEKFCKPIEHRHFLNYVKNRRVSI